jgi:hypothetical protein
MRTPTRQRLAGLLCLPLLAGLTLANPTAAAARTPTVPANLPVLIERLAPYVAQSSCMPSIQAGTAKLARLLVTTYPGPPAYSAYACGTNGPVSEHYEGRAIDWMVSIRNAAQYTSAKSLITWLLATDRSGNKFAMARRLGFMYLIYNNRIWGSWNGLWEAYNDCAHQPQTIYDNSCHRTHVHISLSWNGAMGRTSFWAGHRVYTDFGPCRPRDLNWAAPRVSTNSTECPRYAKVRPAAGASATKIALVTYSGAVVRLGSSGPPVSAVQRALRLSPSGLFNATTRDAVIHFQSTHRLTQSGAVDANTWRALLAAVR